MRIKGANEEKKKTFIFLSSLTWHLIVVDAAVKLVTDRAEINNLQPSKLYIPTGSPSSKYKHRRTSTLLHNIRTIRICVEKKNRFRNLRKSKDFNKKQLTLHKMCVTSLLGGPWSDLWPFYGLYCKWFSLYIRDLYSHSGARAFIPIGKYLHSLSLPPRLAQPNVNTFPIYIHD